MLNEAVKRVLKESMWDLATCAGNEPNVVPVAFKDVTEAGRLVVGDVFLETTLNKQTVAESLFPCTMQRTLRDIRSRERQST